MWYRAVAARPTGWSPRDRRRGWVSPGCAASWYWRGSAPAGAADIHDGHNVVLHEFAHQLDQENGAGDGAPPLARRSAYVAWARVLGHEYDQLVQQVERHHRTLLDEYGATNPAEFFAVVTETFFEKPHELRAHHAELYRQLQEF